MSALESLNRGCLLPSPARSEGRQCRSQRLQVSAAAATAATSVERFRGFMNPQGQVLQEAGQNVWTAARPFRWFSIDVGGASAIIKLSDGSLWVHSPVKLDHELREALEPLGKVKAVVSPNFEHTVHAPQWKEAYPDAVMYGPPGMREKKPELDYQEITDTAPPEWQGEIEPCFLSYESLPVIGKPFFNELIFLHKPSQTLITTDFWWDFPPKDIEPGTQAFKFGMDQIYRPIYQNLLIRDKDLYAQKMKRVFYEWEWDRILPCHGSLLKAGGKERLRHDLNSTMK